MLSVLTKFHFHHFLYVIASSWILLRLDMNLRMAHVKGKSQNPKKLKMKLLPTKQVIHTSQPSMTSQHSLLSNAIAIF